MGAAILGVAAGGGGGHVGCGKGGVGAAILEGVWPMGGAGLRGWGQGRGGHGGVGPGHVRAAILGGRVLMEAAILGVAITMGTPPCWVWPPHT